ncbi:MAG: hypothetical protein K9L88_03385 [Chromatiaceae bacterium]|nr:hypothetical protein [Chromatiaceae bacterium]
MNGDDMNMVLSPTEELASLGAESRLVMQQLHVGAQGMARLGDRLLKLKARWDRHRDGNWTEHCEQTIEGGATFANHCMRITEAFPQLANGENFPRGKFSTATLKALAYSPAEVRSDVIERAEQGETFSVRDIEQMKRDAKAEARHEAEAELAARQALQRAEDTGVTLTTEQFEMIKEEARRQGREEEIDKHARTKANAKRDREALKAREQAAAEQDGAIGQYAQEVTQLRESLAEAQAKLEAAETGALAVAPRIVTRADPEMESRLQELERERQQWEQERKDLAHRLDLRDAQLNDSTKKLAEAIGTAAKHSSPQLVIEQFINSTWLAGTERDLKAVAEIIRRHPALGDHPGLQYRLRSLADLVDGARGAIEMTDVGMLVDA